MSGQVRGRRSAVLDIARTLGLLLVVFKHAYPSTAQVPFGLGPQPVLPSGFGGEAVLDPLLTLFRVVFFGAVPMFFILSGYLSGSKIDDPAVGAMTYLRDRFRMLGIPYLLWNGIVLILVLALAHSGFGSRLAEGGGYFAVGDTVGSHLAAWLGIGRWPISYQLWFVRDLIVVSCVAVFWCRYGPRIPWLGLLLIFMPHQMWVSAGYFLIGYEARRHFQPRDIPSESACVLFIAGWAVLGLALRHGLLEIPWTLVGLGSAMFILTASLLISKAAFAWRIAAAGGATFFIYAAHEPLLTMLLRLWRVAGLPFDHSLVTFAAGPVVTLLFCFAAYRFCLRYLPGLCGLLDGGRVGGMKAAAPAGGRMNPAPGGVRMGRHAETHTLAFLPAGFRSGRGRGFPHRPGKAG